MKRSGWTLIEQLVLTFLITLMYVAGTFFGGFGVWSGVGAAFSVGLLGVYAIVLFYRWIGCRTERSLDAVREKYRDVYRVIAIPNASRNFALPKGAEIRVGDYGWEAGPSRTDGLIYLQGLTLDWRVVWHAGFHAEEIAKVGKKPNSQYDAWYPYWASPPPLPPCPFPVIERETMTLGRPYHSHYYSEQPTAYRPQEPEPPGSGSETV